MALGLPPRLTLLALACVSLAACADALPPPLHSNGDALWRIVHDRCVPDQRAYGNPSPCVLVQPRHDGASGYAVLKDRRGATQYLLIPTTRITGVEAPILLSPHVANFFALAWAQGHFVEDRLGHPLDRTRLSAAVNSAYGRTQDQLHLHIDCVDMGVAAALARADLPDSGAERTVTLKGHSYHVRWIRADQLTSTNPFAQLAQSVPGARRDMASWSLALVGGALGPQAPGFYLLAHRADLTVGDPGSAEELQDHTCAP